MSKEDVICIVRKLDDSIRYRLLKCHHRPESFPVTLQDGCNRSFKPSYFTGRPWLAFSDKLGGSFCIPCVLFADSQKRLLAEALVNRPFKRMARFTSVIKSHADKAYHKDAVVSSKAFLDSLKKPETGNIIISLDRKKQEVIQKNREVLAHIIRSVLWLGRQGVAFRGHRESLTPPTNIKESSNRGNFLELILLLAGYDEGLATHLSTSKKTSYASPDTQNQIISIISNDYIRPRNKGCQVLFNHLRRSYFC